MKIDRKRFIEELESVSGGLTREDTVAQSSCFIFQVTDERGPRVSTFNGDALYTRKTILEIGINAAVPGKLLLSALSRFELDEVQIEEKNGSLVIKDKVAGKRAGVRMQAKILSQLDAVELSTYKWAYLPEDFSKAIDLVSRCCGSDGHPSLGNVRFLSDSIEATDNFQAIRWRTGLPVPFSPALIRGHLLRGFSNLNMVEFRSSKNWIHFQNKEGVEVSCRRSVGDFPCLDDHLKVKGAKVELLDEIKKAIKSAEVFAAENEDCLVRVEIKKINDHLGSIRISGESALGWFREVRNAYYQGPPIKFRIGSKLLASLADMSDCFEVTDGVLKIETDRFTYVTALEEEEK